MSDNAADLCSAELRSEMFADSPDSRQSENCMDEVDIVIQKKVELKNNPSYVSLVDVVEDNESDPSSDPFASSQHSSEPHPPKKRKFERSSFEQRESALFKDEGLATWKLYPD